MKLREGFYGAVDAVIAGLPVDLDAELDRRGVADPRSRALAWDVCQAAAQANEIKHRRAASSSYVAYDHRLRRHIATYLDAGSTDALKLTRTADQLLTRALSMAPVVKKTPVLVAMPRRASRDVSEEPTFTGTAA